MSKSHKTKTPKNTLAAAKAKTIHDLGQMQQVLSQRPDAADLATEVRRTLREVKKL